MKTEKLWQKIGRKAHHGINIALSSIHTQKSSGIGEFLDLIDLIDFCKKVGFDTIQLLPLNDQGTDFSPYNALSSCALDPIYLSLSELPNINGLEKDLVPLKELTTLERVSPYEVKQQKITWLYRYFQKNFKETKSYLDFVEKQKDWLIPYAKFKSLKELYKGIHWKDWPKEHTNFPHIEFIYFIQYLAFSQMDAVHAYAKKEGVLLKGDVPILINADSADVWNEPHLFDFSHVAGAPPDYFNEHGQKWNFPLYNWEEMEKEQFAWWKRRLRVTSELYDLYRLDHIVGFFRIWGIDKDSAATDGEFFPRDESQWIPQGTKILEMMIDSSSALPMGEDLGPLPNEVQPLLKKWGICGLRILRWERTWNNGKSFIPFDQYEPYTITSISTHDSDTLQLWWQNYKEDAKRFCELKNWTYNTKLTESQRLTILQDIHRSTSYFHICLLQEYLALFLELISENPEEERINVPGTVSARNWTYRVKPSIEEMFQHKGLIEKMRKISQYES